MRFQVQRAMHVPTPHLEVTEVHKLLHYGKASCCKAMAHPEVPDPGQAQDTQREAPQLLERVRTHRAASGDVHLRHHHNS